MLSQLQTNVAYFERQIRGDNADNFVLWNDASWLLAGSQMGGQQPQRLALYPNQLPQSQGISDNVSVLTTKRFSKPRC